MPPFFTSGLQPIIARDGEQVILSCIVAGQPWPQIDWYHDNCLVDKKSGMMTIFDSDIGKCSLIIMECFPEDSGIYACRAHNEVGEAFTSARLTIMEDKPWLEAAMPVQSQVYSETIFIHTVPPVNQSEIVSKELQTVITSTGAAPVVRPDIYKQSVTLNIQFPQEQYVLHEPPVEAVLHAHEFTFSETESELEGLEWSDGNISDAALSKFKEIIIREARPFDNYETVTALDMPTIFSVTPRTVAETKHHVLGTLNVEEQTKVHSHEPVRDLATEKWPEHHTKPAVFQMPVMEALGETILEEVEELEELDEQILEAPLAQDNFLAQPGMKAESTESILSLMDHRDPGPQYREQIIQETKPSPVVVEIDLPDKDTSDEESGDVVKVSSVSEMCMEVVAADTIIQNQVTVHVPVIHGQMQSNVNMHETQVEGTPVETAVTFQLGYMDDNEKTSLPADIQDESEPVEIAVTFSVAHPVEVEEELPSRQDSGTLVLESQGEEMIEWKMVSREEASTSEVSVTKSRPDSLVPPHFNEPIAPQVVREGGSAVFRAVVSGFPMPCVMWYWTAPHAQTQIPGQTEDENINNKGVEIQESNLIKKQYDLDSGVITLMLQDVLSAMGSNVSCEAVNSVGRACCTANLVVVREYTVVLVICAICFAP